MITDLLKTSNFFFQTRDSKQIEFFCQEVQIPGYSLGSIDIPYASMKTKRSGDSIEFEDLTLTVLLDEDLSTFKEIYDYLMLTHNTFSNELEVQQQVFDATLFITTNKNNIQHKIHFYSCWFQSISPVQFMTTSTDENNLTFTVGIRYDYYSFNENNA
jgi:hypothetical protein